MAMLNNQICFLISPCHGPRLQSFAQPLEKAAPLIDLTDWLEKVGDRPLVIFVPFEPWTTGELIYIYRLYIMTGWWFGTWMLFFYILGRIIPTDELIFFRGVGKPPTRLIYIYNDIYPWTCIGIIVDLLVFLVVYWCPSSNLNGDFTTKWVSFDVFRGISPVGNTNDQW